MSRHGWNYTKWNTWGYELEINTWRAIDAADFCGAQLIGYRILYICTIIYNKNVYHGIYIEYIYTYTYVHIRVLHVSETFHCSPCYGELEGLFFNKTSKHQRVSRALFKLTKEEHGYGTFHQLLGCRKRCFKTCQNNTDRSGWHCAQLRRVPRKPARSIPSAPWLAGHRLRPFNVQEISQ